MTDIMHGHTTTLVDDGNGIKLGEAIQSVGFAVNLAADGATPNIPGSIIMLPGKVAVINNHQAKQDCHEEAGNIYFQTLREDK